MRSLTFSLLFAVAAVSAAQTNQKTQVLLHIRIAHVEPEIEEALGTNLSSATNVPSGLRVSGFREGVDVADLLHTLSDQNVARPNLLTHDGQEASFTAGGEFPYLQPGATGGGSSVKFQEYGIRLQFLPHLTSADSIHLRVTPSASTLDYVHGITVSGTLLPGISTRRWETELDVTNGQSFAITGLVDNEMIQNFARLPTLLPILTFSEPQKTRLLVIVTPEIVGDSEKLPRFALQE
jgi:pilus assembly protein CpaC